MNLTLTVILQLLSITPACSYFFKRYEDEQDKLSETKIGSFVIKWDSSDPYLIITHSKNPEKVLFQTLPSWPFLTVGFATDTKPPIVDGNYKINEWALFETPYQNIKKVQMISDHEFVIKGELWGMVSLANYEMTFFTPLDEQNKPLLSQLSFNISVTSVQGSFNRVFLNYWCEPSEKFFGFGTQYTYWNMKGRRVPIVVAEQGIGRGAEPFTTFLNLIGDGAGGDWSTTYSPKPIYITNYNRSMIIENSEIMFFDLRDDDAVVIEVWGSSLQGRIIYADSLLNAVSELTLYTGRMNPLPAWTQKGAVVGLEGGTEEVLTLVNRLLTCNDSSDELSHIPLAGVWLQDWVGLRHAFDGDRLKWNWQLDRSHYPKWDEMVYYLHNRGIRVLSYINPFISAAPEDYAVEMDSEIVDNSTLPLLEREKSLKLSSTSIPKVERKLPRNLYNEGVKNGYFVMKKVPKSSLNPNQREKIETVVDETGVIGLNQENPENIDIIKNEENEENKDYITVPYKMRSGSIEFCMFDPTNPFAWKWMKNIIKEDMILNSAVHGWMADFGEYLPFDGVLYNGRSPAEYHNIYPQDWAKLNFEAITEAKREGLIHPVPDIIDNKYNEKVSKKFDKRKKEKGKIYRRKLGNLRNTEDDTENDLIYFMRSGWSKSPPVSRLFWLGDQMVTWDKHDGIKSVLVSAMTSGLGGHSLTHSDIGGYTMQEVGPFPFIRSRELLLRWIELSAFGSSLFRTHIGLINSVNQAQIYDDERTMKHFSLFTRIFSYLADYRMILMREAKDKGWPIIRQLSLHFSYDEICFDITHQFMFGSELLIAPVLNPAKTPLFSVATSTKDSIVPLPGKEAKNEDIFSDILVNSVKVYIPKYTEWIHVWSGQKVIGGEKGRYITVDAPIGRPPVFYLLHTDKNHDFFSLGPKFRDFVVKLGMDTPYPGGTPADVKLHLLKQAVMGNIKDFSEPDWYDWLGIKQFVTVSES